MKRYRLIRAGDTLTMWRTDLNGISKLVGVQEHCPRDAGERMADDAVSRLTLAAEDDHGGLLPWIVVDHQASEVIMTSGLVQERIRT